MHDDLGRDALLYPLASAVAFGRDRGRFDAGTRLRLRRRLRGAVWGVEAWPVALSLVILAGIASTLIVFGGRWIGLVAHTPAVVGGITLALLLGQLIAVGRRSYRRRVFEALLSEGCCPSCGHGLEGASAEGRTVRCPECGAGWLAERVGLQPGEAPPTRVIAGFD